jgi:hypothetical protein
MSTLSSSFANGDPSTIKNSCRSSLTLLCEDFDLSEYIFLDSGVWTHLLTGFDATFGELPFFDLICCLMARILFHVDHAHALASAFSASRVQSILEFVIANPSRPNQYLVNLVCNVLPDLRSGCEAGFPLPFAVFSALRARPLLRVDLIFLRNYCSRTFIADENYASNHRAFIRAVFDLFTEFANDEQLLVLSVAILFREMSQHPSDVVRVLSKRGTSYLGALYALIQHPSPKVAELAIRTVTAAFEPKSEVVRQLDLEGLPLATVFAHCASESHNLARFCVQLLCALCGADSAYCAANGVPEFLVAVAREANAYRIRVEALMTLTVFLTAAELPVLEPTGVHAMLTVLLSGVDADSPIAVNLLWAISILRLKFGAAGLGEQLEDILTECGASEFIEACEDSPDERLAVVLNRMSRQDWSELQPIFAQQSAVHEQVLKLQATVEAAKGKRTIIFVRNSS